LSFNLGGAGIPLVADGKIIGAITSVQDGQVAKAGADVAK
jgi:hypothetical protein